MEPKKQRSATALEKARTRPRTLGEARLMLLRERRISLTDIARTVGKSVGMVSRVTRGERRSETIEREVARRLTLTEDEAFPEWAGRRTPRR